MTNIIGADVSFYQDDDETLRMIDFTKMRTQSEFVKIRVGQNAWVDPDFAHNWQAAKQAGLARGSYWFYDSRVEPTAQAELWVSQFKNDYGELPLWADFEETYNGAYKGWRNFKTFCQRVKALVPTDVEVGIYTGYYYWKDNVESIGGDVEYFSQFPLWIAHYGVTSPLVPKTWEKKGWLFWQFTETGDGKLYGAESNRIDLNYFNGDSAKLHERFNLSGVVVHSPDEITETVTQTHEGVRVHKVSAFGTTVWAHEIELSKVFLWVTNRNDNFKQVLQSVDKNAASGGTNGGGWNQNGTQEANEIWKSRGVLIQPIAKDNRPWVGFTDTKGIMFGQGTPPSNVTDAVGYDRYVLQNGIPNARYENDKVKDARTFSGNMVNGNFLLCVAEGNDIYNKGVTFWEEAQVLLHFGCINGGNHDGGSSSTVINKALSSTEPLNRTSDPQPAFVINAILFKSDETEVPPDTGETNEMKTYEFTVTNSARKTPSMFETATKAGKPVEAVVISDEYKDPKTDAIFVKLPDGWYQPIFYKGQSIAKIIPDVPVTPPASNPVVYMELHRADGTIEKYNVTPA